jgi:hypothetical protein
MNTRGHQDRRLEWNFGAIVLCAVFIFFALAPRHASAAQNLLLNGDFSKGSEDQPDNWRTEAWIQKPEAFVCHWHPSKDGGPGEMEVDNLQDNDGRWKQSLSLTPGWYQLSADIRSENVGTKETGASISVMEDGIMSPELKGTSAWRRVTLYFSVGKGGADIDVALRIGGFASLNSGRAFFRNATLERIDAPPPNASPTFDLTAIRKAGEPVPSGSWWSMVLTFMVLAAIAVVGWRMFVDAPVPVVVERKRKR